MLQLQATGYTGGPGIVLAQKSGHNNTQDFNQQIEGQLFFNSTANAFKETITDIPAGTWASGGNG